MMKNNFLNIKSVLILILSITIIVSMFTIIFKKEYKVAVIKNIDEYAFEDSITDISYYKDDGGPGIETRLKNHDSSFCFSGRNEELKLLYFDYAKKGDVILKEKNAKIFYIKRGENTISFILSKCN